MGKRLVLAGLGHAHLPTMVNLPEIIARGHEVIGINPSALHYYSGMGPGLLGGIYGPDDVRFDVKKMVEQAGATYVEADVVGVDPDVREVLLGNGERVGYDVLSWNIGRVPRFDLVARDTENVFAAKPIEELGRARKKLLELSVKGPVRLGVVGGGAAALELVCNGWACLQENGGQHSVRVYGGKNFLSRITDPVRKRALATMKERGIEIIDGAYVKEVTTGRVVLDDGREFEEDVILTALGSAPSPAFEAVERGASGDLAVNEYLQSVSHPDMFGGGDCIHFIPQPLDKVGVYAVREGSILAHNLLAALEGRPLKSFEAGPPYLLIYNLGQSFGILQKYWFVTSGKLAFKVKDYIDRRFMDKFQSLTK